MRVINRCVLVGLLLVSLSCKNVRHTYLSGEPFYFDQKPTLIVLPIADASEVESWNLFRFISGRLDEDCLQVLYLPQMDYDLKLRNIDAQAVVDGEPQAMQALEGWIPNSYLLDMRLTGAAGPRGAKTPVGKSKWITRVRSVGTADNWTYQTNSEITSVKLNAKDVNMFASPYQMGIRESLDHLMKNALPGCR